ALHPQPAGTRHLEGDPAGLQGQGACRGRCQGSPHPGPLSRISLAANALFRQVVRGFLLTEPPSLLAVGHASNVPACPGTWETCPTARSSLTGGKSCRLGKKP